MWGSIISGGLSLAGGMMGSGAAQGGSKAMQEAAQQQQQIQATQQAITRGDLSPFLSTGQKANKRLALLLGLGGTPGGTGLDFATAAKARIDPLRAQYAGYADYQPDWANARTAAYMAAQSDVDNQVDSNDPTYGSLMNKFTMADRNNDPVYQSGLDFGASEGRGAINARAIQNGGYDSGATLKALTRFGNDYGSTKAGESYNRFMNDKSSVYSMLSGTSNSGQNAANTLANVGQQGANAMGQSAGDIGQAQAAGQMGSANAWANAFGGLGTALQGYSNRPKTPWASSTSFGINDGGPGGWN